MDGPDTVVIILLLGDVGTVCGVYCLRREDIGFFREDHQMFGRRVEEAKVQRYKR